MSNEKRISASRRDILQSYLNIAGKFTDIENTDYLKSGLFGYITESLAMMTRDSALHKTMLYNESNLSTAIIPKTVYNWAKMFNIEVNKASPAYATINIIIPSDVLSGLFQEDNNNSVRIDRSNMIIAGSYYFSLEHSIIITKKGDDNAGSQLFKARYDLDEDTSTSFETINGDGILRVRYEEGNTIIEARAYQYQQKTISRQLSAANYENKVQLFEFQDQFCGAKLYYEYNGLREEVELRYSKIGNYGDTDKFAYYSLTGENELEIVFDATSNTGFMPAANSRLLLTLYTTKGTNIERNFSGDAIFRFSDDKMKVLGIIVHFNPTNIIGGYDVPSIETIKKTIIKQLSTCNTIVTETDLNNYFETLTSLLETVNNGRVTFIKKRDDILKRIFNAYILLRDGLTDDNSTQASSSYISKCVPTTTLNEVYCDPTASLNQGKFLNVMYDNTDGKYHSNGPISGTDGYYFCPFYTYVQYSPIKRIRYIYPLTDNSSTVSIVDDRLELDNGEYIVPEDIRLYRGITSNASPSGAYTIFIKLNTNISSAVFQDIFGLKITFKDSSENILGTVKAVAPDYSVSTTVNGSGETVDNSITLSLDVGINGFGTSTEFDESSYYSTIVLNGGSGAININETARIFVSIIKRDGNGDAIQNNKVEFGSNTPLYFFRSLDDIMNSDLTIVSHAEVDGNDEATGNEIVDTVVIKDLPVVHTSFLDNGNYEVVKSKFIEQLFTYITLLKENLNKLETSTFFNLKFYNTYGLSKFYNCQNTNLDVDLTIYINKDYASANNITQIQDEIRSYIRRAIDKANERGELSLSSIIGLIGRDDTYGKYIHHVEWNGLNGLFNQYIYKADGIDETQDAPEWLNIPYENLSSIKFETLKK